MLSAGCRVLGPVLAVYPTLTDPVELELGPHRVEAAVDASPAAGPWPLLAIAGAEPFEHVDLAVALAAAGAVCVLADKPAVDDLLADDALGAVTEPSSYALIAYDAAAPDLADERLAALILAGVVLAVPGEVEADVPVLAADLPLTAGAVLDFLRTAGV